MPEGTDRLGLPLPSGMAETTMRRRTFLGVAAGAAGAAALPGCGSIDTICTGPFPPVTVNDVHAQISATRVAGVREPAGLGEAAGGIRSGGVSVCGGRYSSGGQAFRTDGVLVDTRRMSGVTSIDQGAGLVTAAAGTRWPELIAALRERAPGWTIRQKQSGADEVSLGGTLSVNAHGRCLDQAPIVQDVESLTVYDPGSGKILRCSRTENADRFARVVGGLGLFGVITDVTLRLVPRRLQQRRTEYAPADEAVARLDAAAVRGATHGDFQYVVDETDPDFMRAGLVMTYEPAEAGAEPGPLLQDAALFTKLAVLAHADRPAGWLAYKRQVLAPSPVAAWSDQWQMATYAHGYHREVERATGMPRGSEILSELFVPRDQLAAHLEASAAAIRLAGVPLIYGNVRLIEPDRETALPWARGRFACVVSNLHADHTPAGLGAVRDAFRGMLDDALARGGTYYLAHHRFARPDQVKAAWPGLAEHLTEATRLDPRRRVWSDFAAAYA